ncbi:hypothetical protein, partial [Paenibacillus xylanexedens]|uniref:hypothetical protein n=1 Tax=Paenibacillus xylanexedens TaxID=528191 RepID=UPI003D053B5C
SILPRNGFFLFYNLENKTVPSHFYDLWDSPFLVFARVVAGEERDRYNKVQSELRRLDRQRWGEY